MPLAEDLGLSRVIGGAVLRAACARAAADGQTVAVALSGEDIADPGLPAEVAVALAETGLPAERLLLEVAEAVLMADPEASIGRLDALKALGVRLAVGDFGAGASSLRYLPRFGADFVKLSPAFAEAMAREAALGPAVIELAARLGLRVVA
jgi:EAL domain-containing protein (putative c-di-GMP-specific phosphodiesterase class I)